MNYNPNQESERQMWLQKEKRELFCKFVNSTLMNNPEINLVTVKDDAKYIVDKAFELYPDGVKEETKERPF